MKATRKEEEIMMEIYKKLYLEIGVDLDELIQNGTTKNEGWFNDYFLNNQKQSEIIECVLKKYKLSKLKKQLIRNSIWLGASPNSKK